MTHHSESLSDARICPLCEQSNRCMREDGHSDCWCLALPLPSHIAAKMGQQPAKACFCQSCWQTVSPQDESQ